jgi:hypothetical protein
LLAGESKIFHTIFAYKMHGKPGHFGVCFAVLTRAFPSVVKRREFEAMAISRRSSMLLVMALVLGTVSLATAASGVATFYTQYTRKIESTS